MQTNDRQYQTMTQTPVGTLVVKLSIPTTISMLITNVYNTVDTYFVSTLGNSAAGAVGIVFGLMAILQAFGFMFGHGAGSHVSQSLGAQDLKRARTFASTSFYLSLLSGLMIMICGLLFLDPLMYLLGSTDTILPYARTYAFYILVAAPAMTASCVMNNILRYEGHASLAMIGLSSGSVLNIFGDYVLMSCFHYGIAGAGLSTCLSQYISFFILLFMFYGKRTKSKFYLREMSLKLGIVSGIFTVGFPSLCRQGLNSIATMVLNTQAKLYGGDVAIAAMSIVARIVMLIFSVGLGIGQGFQPVAAFNYGAKKYQRLRAAFIFTLQFGLVSLSLLSGIGFVFARSIVAIFRDDPAVIAIACKALRYQCIALATLPVNVCANMLFQSIGKGGRATFLAVLRSGFGFIPLAYLLPPFLGLQGLQLAQPISDFMSSVIAVPFLLHFFRHMPKDA